MRFTMMMMAGAAMLVAGQAQAMVKVVNLSNMPQTVVFESAGTATRRVIAPNDVERFGGTDGFLSLEKAPGAKPGMVPQDGPVGFSGMLSGVVGAVRTSHIPASPMDEFVIWPDGRLLLQKRQKSGRRFD